MADYYPVLTRAISGLEPNTAEARRAVYERARQAIVKQLRSYDPPLTESEITKERLGLEEAVRRIESETRAAASAGRPPEAPAVRAPMAPSVNVPPPPRPESGAQEASRTGAPAAPPRAPSPPASRMPGSEGLTKVHAAAAAAASLGAATASAQASASTTRAAFEPASPTQAPRALPPRVDPKFERPRVPGPLPEPRMDAFRSEPRFPEMGDHNPNLREPESEPETAPRRLNIGVLVALVLFVGLGIGAYLARDTISAMIGGEETPVATDGGGPKVADRVGTSDAVPGTIAQDTPAPADQAAVAPPEPAPAAPGVSADTANLVSQRAILYDEAPDKQGGAASSGAVVWRTEPIPNNTAEIRLVGEATIPDRGMTVTLTLMRNLDNTLPASHVIEIGFAVPPDFPNVGIGNVPGILFKDTEEEGGSALKGMSVKVTKNLFWIGLEASPADREQNLQAIRTRGWIDIPILYDNGRRGVLTLEKGTPGERAFEEAFGAWNTTPSATTTP